MKPKFWMISDRDKIGKGLGIIRAATTYWTSTGGNLDSLANWTETTKDDFAKQLLKATGNFPLILDRERHEDQKHLCFLVHGYSRDWKSAIHLYEKVCQNLFDGPDGMGICILFSWPSDGLLTNYLPDLIDARLCAPDLAQVFSDLYELLVERQKEGAGDPEKSCRAKISCIAHSMGNFVLQKALQLVWTRHNQPLLVSLLNQAIMVAADVDNDLFKSGENVDGSDGDAMANLSYRIGALYTGRDAALALSAGVKHFGKRRLGRTGLDRTSHAPDNVWDLDCSAFFASDRIAVHNAYFENDSINQIVRWILQGVDREIILQRASQLPPK